MLYELLCTYNDSSQNTETTMKTPAINLLHTAVLFNSARSYFHSSDYQSCVFRSIENHARFLFIKILFEEKVSQLIKTNIPKNQYTVTW